MSDLKPKRVSNFPAPELDLKEIKNRQDYSVYNVNRKPHARSSDQRKKIQFYVNEQLDISLEIYCLDTFQTRSSLIRKLLYDYLTEKGALLYGDSLELAKKRIEEMNQ
ncbi:hypothetical protein [Geobacillus sp. WSUCF-018B]|uniref:hypothetical protein n=1 Tax=Geobacillus sp. WSUCF-018B TaxID=2055939 RepID=UPI000C28D5BB|nr:hypothetical protein [Geobacillus sp. WSUCF-018B]PJW18896.1 hypothetical protein CV944_01450 [Geobacillus sp. WSUCF-018B]